MALRRTDFLSVASMLTSVPSVAIYFEVRVPESTPAIDQIFLAGNVRALGKWSPAGLPLTRQDDGAWTALVHVPLGTKLEFKITRGSWNTVEKDENGEEMGNRAHLALGPARLALSVHDWRSSISEAPPVRVPSHVAGDVRLHESVRSRHLGNERGIWVWLPPEYDARSDRYPVLYMHDGQNLFDASRAFGGIEWGADETAQRLVEEGSVPPLIIVGIENTDRRIDEYAPTRDPAYDEGGRGAEYARFIVDELKPFIDHTYRTRPGRASTMIAGSSLGGLISMWMCRAYPDIFGAAAALSPSLWWDRRELLESWKADPSCARGLRLWVDVGTREGRKWDVKEAASDAVRNVRDLRTCLSGAGLREGTDFVCREYEGGTHHESSWAQRFPDVLRFLLATKSEG